jgi:hypothetical protein
MLTKNHTVVSLIGIAVACIAVQDFARAESESVVIKNTTAHPVPVTVTNTLPPLTGNVGITGTPNVNVVNTPMVTVTNPVGAVTVNPGSAPIPVTGTVNIGTMPEVNATFTDPAHTAVSGNNARLLFGRTLTQDLFQIPSGQRLVIETASAYCEVLMGHQPPWNINLNVISPAGNVVTFPFPLQKTGTLEPYTDYYVGYINSKIYADPLPAGFPSVFLMGATMSVFGGYSTAAGAYAACNFNFSGYLVALP